MGFIYVIENDINNKLYVGKTVTTLLNRWYHHKSAYLKEDWHLYRAMRKYGFEHFQMKELEQCDDSIIDEREQYWIDKLDTYNNGYNMTIGGEGRTSLDRKAIIQMWNDGYSALQIANELGNGWSCSIIDILKQNNLYDAEEIKRRKILDIAKKQSKKIIQYNEKAEIIGIFNSKKEAEEKTGINCKNISTALTAHTGAGGFLWRYEGEAPPVPRKIKTQKKRKVEQIDLNTGETIAIYNSAKQAAQVLKADSSCISKVCRGIRNKHHGYGWRYVEEE